MDHSEWFGEKYIFRKKFDGSSNMAIFGHYGSVFFEPDFSQTWNFHQLFLTFQITISESLGKILRQKIYQKIFGIIKKTVFLKILNDPDFFWKNPLVSFEPL